MVDIIFRINLNTDNKSKKKKIMKFIFNSYINIAKEKITELNYEEKEIDYDRYFNNKFEEFEINNYYNIKSESVGFNLSEEKNVINGIMIEYEPLSWAIIDDNVKIVNENIIKKFNKYINYLNISVESVNLFDSGFGNNIYFNNIGTFFEILKHSSYIINDSTETKNNLLKFLKQENVIENDAINLIGNDKYPIRKKIYDYLWNNKIITRKTT